MGGKGEQKKRRWEKKNRRGIVRDEGRGKKEEKRKGMRRV